MELELCAPRSASLWMKTFAHEQRSLLRRDPVPGPELGYLKPVLCGRKLIKRTKDDSILLSAAKVSGHM
jgi:hypothetical protein